MNIELNIFELRRISVHVNSSNYIQDKPGFSAFADQRFVAVSPTPAFLLHFKTATK